MDLMMLIQSISQPVIAQVKGIATAAGCQLVAASDLAVAEEDALFATPGVKIGLFCPTPMVALSRAVGRKKALEMLLTGRFNSASEARDYGLINSVVPSARLEEETWELARDISQYSLITIGIGKSAFYQQVNMDDSQAYHYAKEVISSNAVMADAQEGMAAFLEKRKPVWKEK
jgi:enoyl-CoA hydratase/carnithine racemase